MPRRPRLEGAGAIHHVVAKAASGGRIVHDDADRLRFLDELRAVVRELGWVCLAYCVMDTHVHLVVCTPEPNLGRGMKLLLGRYAITYNRRHGRSGYVFARPFWSRRVDRPHYVRCAGLYTVMNPVAASICSHPSLFGWCSYAETVGPAAGSGLLAPELLLLAFDEEPARARVVYRDVVDDAVERLAHRRAQETWWRAVQQADREPGGEAEASPRATAVSFPPRA